VDVSDKETETTGAGFDEVLARLRAVVGRLEQGNLSLEESLQAYEQGVALARRGHELLDNVEKRVDVLVRGAGGDRVEPLDGDEGDSGETR
jgi:exodeoxyribonuclease VII small subunit